MMINGYLHIMCSALILLFSVFADMDLYAKSDSGSFADAEKLFLEGNYDSVIRESVKLIDSGYGRKEDLYYLKGLSELKTGKFGDARRSFEEITEMDKNSDITFDACMGIGDAYFLEGNKTRAVKTYQEIIERFSGNKNLVLARDRLKQASTGKPVAGEDLHGSFMVQAGCFGSKSNAERLARKLSAKGYKARVEIPAAQEDRFYRVKVTGAGSRSQAEELSSRLRRDGFDTEICQQD
jgi:tetratricopeptide (TPR) repeat protein